MRHSRRSARCSRPRARISRCVRARSSRNAPAPGRAACRPTTTKAPGCGSTFAARPDGASERRRVRRLELTSAARRARADRLEQTLEIAAVDGLIDEAVNRAHPDEQIANTLYELLLPTELKADLQAADNLSLLVDAATAHYPWEALAPRGDDGELRPLALGAGMLRQFADSDTRNARFAVRHAAGRHALVVGNPPAGPAQDPPGRSRGSGLCRRAPLRQYERRRAAFRRRRADWKDGELDSSGLPADTQDDSWTEIVNALYRFQYRVVHIAAHGAFNRTSLPSRES